MLRPAGLCCLVFLVAGAARAGETRCWFERGAVVVPAAFGDIAGDFILDLSAPTSRLHETRARSDGIDAGSARRDLVVAGERVAGLSMEVVDLDARTRDFVTSMAGVLGADVAGRFVVDLRFAPCRIRLYRRPPAHLKGRVRLKVTREAGVPAIRATISDGVTTRAGLFAIDTGAAPTGLAHARLSRTPAVGHSPPVRLRALSLAGALFEQIPAAVLAGSSPALDGAIGTAVWSRFRMRLDVRRGWLELARPSDRGRPRPRLGEDAHGP